MQKLLVVEDDRKLNRALCYALEKEGYGVVSSYTIEEAKRAYMQGTGGGAGFVSDGAGFGGGRAERV